MYKDLIVYVDSDGVVSDFDGHFYDLFGFRTHEAHKGKVWAKIESVNNTTPFFRTMPKMSDADLLLDYVHNNFEKYAILTATGSTPQDVEQQKRDWYAELYPHVTVHCVAKSPDKAAQFATPTAILIDDRAKSIDPWIEAGGIGILHESAEQTIAELEYLLEYGLTRPKL